MKTTTIVLLTALLMGSNVSANINGDGTLLPYSIDTKTSKVYWTATKIGGSHTGTISIAKGTITTKNNGVYSASIVMDMKTIDNTDLDEPGYKAKLEGHLKSEDFFSVEKFPQALFEAKQFTPIKDAKTGASNYTITGDLTIKGITHAVSFPVTVAINGNKVTTKGTLIFDRSKWNVKYGSGSFFEGLGDHLIYDDVALKFELYASSSQVN